eukprot:CAMPEP_0114626342 /NCGR_PEP_ID=MMETSP0168-20121206/11732_1 /TAXON_ID=95228 ORGANISM="Vannella sp., Strain DIVA3 517/6/12" /NCGR_SAMPLE_ID=MMETSP0168 /ASSEMBLY_ACC=CAM_ASM_000044 /LENGTH=623 /DNA_ID=CAMNT_0001837643 /DNA_START=11 /DNA_END=1878 /DNA_ORIENTATION=-
MADEKERDKEQEAETGRGKESGLKSPAGKEAESKGKKTSHSRRSSRGKGSRGGDKLHSNSKSPGGKAGQRSSGKKASKSPKKREKRKSEEAPAKNTEVADGAGDALVKDSTPAGAHEAADAEAVAGETEKVASGPSGAVRPARDSESEEEKDSASDDGADGASQEEVAGGAVGSQVNSGKERETEDAAEEGSPIEKAGDGEDTAGKESGEEEEEKCGGADEEKESDEEEKAAVKKEDEEEKRKKKAGEEEEEEQADEEDEEEKGDEKEEQESEEEKAEKEQSEEEEEKAEVTANGKAEEEEAAAEVPVEAVAVVEEEPKKDSAKEKKKKKRMSLIGGLLGSSSQPVVAEAEVTTDALDIENAILNSGSAQCLGQMKYVGSPKKLQKRVLKMQRQKFVIDDVQTLKSHIVHGWYVDCTCGLRGVNVDDGKKMMQCDVCKAWQHCKCNGLAAYTEEQLTRLKAKKVWVCQTCKLGRYKYQGHFWQMERKKQIRQLKQDKARLDKELGGATADAPPTITVDPPANAKASPDTTVKPGHSRSRSVGFSRKVVVHRLLSVEESEAARQGAKETVRRSSAGLRSILRTEPQEFPEAPLLPTPMDMLQEPGASPSVKKSKFSKALTKLAS